MSSILENVGYSHCTRKNKIIIEYKLSHKLIEK